jgi:tRNA pseudouridine55 synthase
LSSSLLIKPSGWLVLDKPEGLSSTRLGSRVKRITGQKKIGHLGTLDPAASGVLVLALGEATKLIPYYTSFQKVYEFFLNFGELRDTGDAEGQVVEISSVRPTNQDVENILSQFLGSQLQTPPAYSAIWVNGRRAYELARNDEVVVLKPRSIHIDSLHVLYGERDVYKLRVSCSPGTYVRSLGQDVARALGTVGYVSHIRRTVDGKFSQSDTISLEKLEEISHTIDVTTLVKPLGFVLDDIPAVTVWGEDVHRLQQGRCVPIHKVPDTPCIRLEDSRGLFGLGYVVDGFLFPKRILTI